MFWSDHDPTARPWSRQYRAAVFAHDDAQAALARASLAAVEARLGRRVTTAVEPFTGFTLAEAYHQKYTLRHTPAFLLACGAWDDDLDALLVDSTACARLNGYLSGHGSLAQLEAELPALALPEGLARALRDDLRARGDEGAPGCQ